MIFQNRAQMDEWMKEWEDAEADEKVHAIMKDHRVVIPALTGGSSDYYKVRVENPTTPGAAQYTAECNDIIEALGMDFAEGNAFKAIWRKAAARMGNGKPGNTALYDAEKVEFFGHRMVVTEKARAKE